MAMYYGGGIFDWLGGLKPFWEKTPEELIKEVVDTPAILPIGGVIKIPAQLITKGVLIGGGALMGWLLGRGGAAPQELEQAAEQVVEPEQDVVIDVEPEQTTDVDTDIPIDIKPDITTDVLIGDVSGVIGDIGTTTQITQTYPTTITETTSIQEALTETTTIQETISYIGQEAAQAQEQGMGIIELALVAAVAYFALKGKSK